MFMETSANYFNSIVKTPMTWPLACCLPPFALRFLISVNGAVCYPPSELCTMKTLCPSHADLRFGYPFLFVILPCRFSGTFHLSISGIKFPLHASLAHYQF